MSRKKPANAPNSRTTIHDIARLAEVSLGTVSHVINGKVGVRPQVRARVLKAIDELGYQPNQLSRALRTNRINLIGMIIPDIMNPFFPAVVRGVEDAAFRSCLKSAMQNALVVSEWVSSATPSKITSSRECGPQSGPVVYT